MTDPSGKNQESIEEISVLKTRIRKLEKSEADLKQTEQEIALLADIGRLISSTLNIDEVYGRFAAETQKLILFDSLTINLCDLHEKTMCVGYVSGLDIDGRRQGDTLVPEGSLSEAVISARTGLIIQPEDIDGIVARFPRLSPIFQAGLRSIMCIPLVFRDEVIGVLHFRSKKPNAYARQDLRLAEKIGMQIAGAIANARTEKALRASEERYHRIADAVTDYIFTAHIEDGKVVKTVHGPGCIAITGYSTGEFAADPYLWFNMVVPEDRDHVQKYASRILTGQHLDPVEHRIRRKDGRVRWVLNTPVPHHDSSGALISYDGLISDITLRKRAEKEKERLEAQNRQLQKSESLGRMAGAIAHHFNNQLGVVIGNLEMAIDDLPQGAGPVNSLTAAMNASLRAAEISGLMLTYLGQPSGKHEPLDLSEACRRSLPILRAAMPGEFLLESDFPAPGPVVRANGNQIQQVLTNLATNAGEAFAEGAGSIHLCVKTVFPSDIPAAYRHPMDWQPQDHAYACLEVADTGCGIADRDIEKLFDPFYSSKFTGRGLGLPVILGIVKAHGGVVTVESEPGRGSTFRVFLPVSEEKLRPQAGPEFQTPETAGSGTILLVEDEEMVRDMTEAMLARLGFTVLAAKDGVEAVEVFRRRRDEIRCVLCDLTMPLMNGWETLTALRKLAPGVPMVLASGYNKAQAMAGDHPELPQAFLGKPYKLKELGNAIGKALAGGSKRMAG
jgi:PAS domain S-box-containing protein